MNRRRSLRPFISAWALTLMPVRPAVLGVMNVGFLNAHLNVLAFYEVADSVYYGLFRWEFAC